MAGLHKSINQSESANLPTVNEPEYFSSPTDPKPHREDDLAAESSSESEYQHALEVIFDPDNQHRRKSSIVALDGPRVGHSAAISKGRTQCQVHQLLEYRRRAKQRSSGGNQHRDVSPLKGVREEEERRTDKDGVCGDGDGGGAALEQSHGKHSRLMTKRELSEMAVGMRELSKRLGSIRLKLQVQTVFLLTKARDESLIEKTREVTEWLLSKERETQYTVYVENTLEENHLFDAKGLLKKDESYKSRLKYWDNDVCRQRPQTFDFVVSLGGDGTVLYASWLFQRIVPPTLSFSLGSLGFLTKFDFSAFRDILTSAFRNGVVVSLRLRFECTIMRSQARKQDGSRGGGGGGGGGKPKDLVEELLGEESDDQHTHSPDGSYEILNDVVVDRGPNATMSAIEVFGDDEHFTTVQADGVCVATPTGSTAYNLSAGGSLCHPDNPVILVTAICAHTLSFRPIILPDTIVLRIGVPYDARTGSWASFDGRERVELFPGDYVTISASRFPFANVMPGCRTSEDWVNSISRTLQWNSRQRQKSFKDWSEEQEHKSSEESEE